MPKSKKRAFKPTKKQSKNHSMKQKLWYMKGCAKHHSSLKRKCNVCNWTAQMGGSCGCNLLPMQNGGNFYKPPSPLPGPFVGKSWTPQIEGWPGVNGVGADRNYLAQNLYPSDPQTMMKLGGKKRRKINKSKKTRSLRSKKAGNLISQDLVNLGRSISFNMGSAYNALNGYPAPVNPLPYKDQLVSANQKTIIV